MLRGIWFFLLVALCIGIAEAQDFACAERDAPNTVAGINVTEICFWDFYNKSVAEYKFYGAAEVKIPLNKLERTLIPSKKAHYTVVTTPLTNTTLTSFPEFAIYNKSSQLNVHIKLKSSPSAALPLVVKLDNSKVMDFIGDIDEIDDKIKELTIVELLRMSDYAYAFNGTGWAKVEFNESAEKFEVKQTNGAFNVGGNIVDTIRMNSIDLSNFWLNNSSISVGLPSELRQMSPGYYAVVALSVDGNGNPTFKLFAPFVVISGNAPSFSSSIVKGTDLQLNYVTQFDMSFALLLKNVKYDAKAEVDLTKELIKSLKFNLTYGSKQLEEVKILDKSVGVFAPKGMFSYAYETEETYLSLSTDNLETGEYVLYIATFGDDLEPYYFGTATITINEPVVPTTPTPKPRPAGGGGGGGGYIPGTGVFHTPLEIVKAGESYEFVMPQSFMIETGIVSVTVKPEDNVNVRIRIERLKELPAGIPEPEGMIAAWSISLTLSKETSASGKIKFRISIEEIRAKGFDPNLIALILMKWDGSKWIELPTSFIDSDGKFNYYEAETPSFSYFAAVIKAAPTPTPTTPPPTTPPVTTPPAITPTPAPAPDYTGIAIAIVAILVIAGAAIYLLRRKR